MRSSPKETATAAIPIHRVHPPSFWKGMILAATVIVVVPSGQVSAEDKGQGTRGHALLIRMGRLSARLQNLNRTKIGYQTCAYYHGQNI
ncbi:hypothetical protein CN168_31870 [Sinorhizobium medicae]|nr:hypothetical protein CN168_31870 [Sinorhizobium medicae]